MDRMEKINKVKPLRVDQKIALRLKNTLKRNFVAYVLSALAGLGAGNVVQDASRGITGYSPAKYAEALNKATPKVEIPSSKAGGKNQQEGQRRDISKWFKEAWAKIKQAGTNPKEFIEDTEAYKSLLVKYYAVLKVIDDVSFWGPGLLVFIMLGGFVSRKIKEMQGDVVNKKEHERMRKTINELVDAANLMMEKIGREGPQSLTSEEVVQVKGILREGGKLLPSGDNLLLSPPPSPLPPGMIRNKRGESL